MKREEFPCLVKKDETFVGGNGESTLTNSKSLWLIINSNPSKVGNCNDV